MGRTGFLHHSGYVNLLLTDIHAQPQTETSLCLHNYGLHAKTFDINYHIRSEKLSREKTFANFKVWWLFARIFTVKFGGVVSAQASKPLKFLHKKHIVFLFVKVLSCESFHYTVKPHLPSRTCARHKIGPSK